MRERERERERRGKTKWNKAILFDNSQQKKWKEIQNGKKNNSKLNAITEWERGREIDLKLAWTISELNYSANNKDWLDIFDFDLMNIVHKII